MKEEYVDELDDTLDDVEPVVDNPAEQIGRAHV